LKLKYDQPLSSVAFKFNLRRYDVGMYVTREANQMVEEMMLLANVASAEVGCCRLTV
jgi:exoribonuclease R